MEALITNVNWLGVGLSTIICFLLGALWFSEMCFGIKWAEGINIKIGPGEKQSVPALVNQFLGTLLLAWIVSLAVGNDSIAFVVLISFTFVFLLTASKLIAGHTVYASIAEGAFVIVMSIIMVICNLIL